MAKNMTNYNFFSRFESWLSSHVTLLAFFIVISGFFVYLYYASGYYLNPDEASHFVFANQETLLDAYLASHSTSHPPLMIMILHLFLGIGKSVFMLRLLSALFCAAAAWLAFKWIKDTYGSVEAITGLVLLTFSPAMVSAASEVRQYAMLLFFICGALYSMQRFLKEKSLRWGLVYTGFLYGAIVTHYSAILITLTLAIYVTILLFRNNYGRRFNFFWVISQAGVIVLYLLLYVTHIKWMLNSGFARDQIQGYLKSMYFFAGTETIISFVSRNTVDFFAYITGVKLVGYLAMFCFLAGIVYIICKSINDTRYREKQYDSFLLIFPFIIAIPAALLKVMPFGGSRHSTYLLPFAITLIALCVVRVFSLKKVSFIIIAAVIMLSMWLSNIHLPNADLDMSDTYMRDVLTKLNEKVPANSVLFVDDMTHYVLAYYLASDQSSLKCVRHETLCEKQMGKYRVVHAKPWAFSPSNFEHELFTLSRFYDFASEDGVWIMTVGWGDTSKMFNTFLSNYPLGRIRERWNFGPIILLQIAMPPKMGPFSTI